MVAVDRTQHGGYFALQLTSKIKIEGNRPGTQEPTESTEAERTETERFVWSGERYTKAGAP
jgi:hypothetical protein